jgi:hypothetical protein
MPSTYTLNNGIELIGTGEQSGTWGDTTNTNLDLLDAALDGQVTITLGAAGSSGSPNALPITDGTASNGRNRMVVFADGADLGATAYVQLTPNDAEKIIYIRNSLSGSRSVILFQGTYNASNDYEVPAGTTAVVYFDGAGAGAVAANVFNNAYFDGLRLGSVSVTAILDEDNMASDSATALATQQSIKAYVDSQVGTVDTLSEILANGNTTGATDIDVDGAQKVQFRDAAIYINSSVDGQLDIVADTEIQIAATTVDLNGNLDVSGTLGVTGVLTTTATQVATGGITSGSSIISDTDSTDSLGSTGVRWLKGWFDTLTAGTLTIGSGSVTDSSGAISFGNENLTTTGIVTAAGTSVFTNLDISGDIDVDGTTNLDVVDIDGAVNMATTALVTGVLTTTAATVSNGGGQFNGAINVGVDDTGYDVKFFGATTGKSLLWDESADSLIVTGTTTLVGTTNLDAVDIDGATQIDATVTVGVDDTGYDVKFFGATAGKYMLWDESADTLEVSGTVVAGAGTALLPSITTTGDLNTGMWFPAADTIAFSEGGVEALRIDSSGNVGIGTSTAYTGAKLSVNGGIVQPSGDQNTIGVYGTSGLQMIGVTGGDNVIGTMGAAEPLVLRTGSTERMRIDSSGNVVIGSSTANGRFSVTPSSNPTSLATSTTITLNESTNNAAYQLRMAYSYLSSVYTGVIDAVQNSLGAPLALNPTGGNVGIGTTTPASATGFGSSGILHIKGSTGNDCSIVLEGLSGSGGRQEIGASSGALQFYRGAATGGMTHSMSIDSSGNLLVGATSAFNGKVNISSGTATGTTYVPLALQGGSTAYVKQQQTVSVSTSPVAILNSPEYATFCLVYGQDVGDRFADVVLMSVGTGTVNVISSLTASGSPAARTYTQSASTLRVAMASGTYTVRLTALTM